MTTSEIAQKLGSTESKVAKALEDLGLSPESVNDSMLAAIGEAVFGGGLVTSTAPLATKTVEPKAVKAEKGSRRKTKLKDASIEVANKEATDLANGKIKAAQEQPIVLQQLADRSDAVDGIDLMTQQLATQFGSDVQSLASLLNPETYALKAIGAAQQLADRQSTYMQSQGVSVESIVAAAIPKRTRLNFDDILAAQMELQAAAYTEG